MVMAAAALVLCLALGIPYAQAFTDPTTLTAIGPPKLTVNLTYEVNGVTLAASTPCTSTALNSPCLERIQAADPSDAVKISYAVKTGFPVNSTAYVQLKACYSTYSQQDRPWRKANTKISADKACAFSIKTKLSPTSGTASWTPPNTVPHSTYFVRAYVYCPSTDPGAPKGIPAGTFWPCAYGNSAGYFQVQPINSRPSSLVGGGIGAILAGPVVLACVIIIDRKVLRRGAV